LTEKSIATGTRRIEAVTQKQAWNWYSGQNQMLSKVCQLLDVQASQLDKKVEKLLAQIKSLENDVKSSASKSSSSQSILIPSTFESLPLTLHTTENISDSKLLRMQVEDISDKFPESIHILVCNDKIVLSFNKKHTHIKANEVFQALTKHIPLQGGGSPRVAQGTIIKPKDIVNQFQQLPKLK
jgi:alanyl-tRNA synthetase